MNRKLLILAGCTLLLTFFVNLTLAEEGIVNYAVADVDGDMSEWDMTEAGPDFYAYMYRAGDPNKPIESHLSLRYNCSTQVLTVLVDAIDGVPIIASSPETAHVKLGNSNKLVDGNDGDDGIAPDFQWINRSADESEADGWEASTQLAPGFYPNLNVHTNVFDSGGSQTSAVANRAINLDILCPDPLAVSLNQLNTNTLNWTLVIMVSAVILLALSSVWRFRTDD